MSKVEVHPEKFRDELLEEELHDKRLLKRTQMVGIRERRVGPRKSTKMSTSPFLNG